MSNLSEKHIPTPLIKTGWIRALLFFGISALANHMFFVLSFLLLEEWGIDTYGLSENAEQLPILVLMIFVQALMIIGLVWGFRKYIDNQSFSSLGLNIKGRIKDFVYGFLLGGVLMGLGFLILWKMNYLIITEIQFRPYFLFSHFLLFSFVAFQEEVANRGYILTNFLDSLPKYLALFCSAIIFGVLHAFNPNLSEIGLLSIVLGGILMGIYYVHQRNLWFPIGLHLSWNFVQGSVLGFNISGQELDTTALIAHDISGPIWITGGNFGFEGSVVACGLVVMMIPIVHFLYRK